MLRWLGVEIILCFDDMRNEQYLLYNTSIHHVRLNVIQVQIYWSIKDVTKNTQKYIHLHLEACV